MGEPALQRATYGEYLHQQAHSEEKLEFVDGEIVAMAGGTRDHATISGNLYFELRLALRGRPCRVHNDAQKFRSPIFRNTRLPDAMVVCGPPEVDPGDAEAIVNPVVVCEVLSTGTEGTDRGDKFLEYRSTPSVQEVVFLSSRQVRIEVYRRADSGWMMTEYTEGEVPLPAIDVRLPLDALYAHTRIAAEAADATPE